MHDVYSASVTDGQTDGQNCSRFMSNAKSSDMRLTAALNIRMYTTRL